MEVRRGRVITLMYKVSSDEGEVLDQVFSDAALSYVQGSGRLMPEVEARLDGMEPGERAVFRLEAPRNDDKRRFHSSLKLSIDALPEDVEVRIGAVVVADGPTGEMHLWIKEVHGETVILDPRHPLTGINLNYDITIIDVRSQTEDEEADTQIVV